MIRHIKNSVEDVSSLSEDSAKGTSDIAERIVNVSNNAEYVENRVSDADKVLNKLENSVSTFNI